MTRLHSTTLALAAAALACGGNGTDSTTEDQTSTPTFELAGTWDDNFGGTTTITAEKWGNDTLAKFDNGTNIAYVQLAASDEYNPNKFTKHVWTEPQNGVFYDCIVAYGLDTLAAAEANTTVPDDSKPEEGGCGNFAWTKMTRQP
jgi:hypothetical protein